MRHFFLILMMSFGLVSPVQAEDRTTLGFGRMFTNDVFGDGFDRWRTASYNFSIIRGPEWQGTRPGRPGAVLEYRLRNEIITPARRVTGGRFDRPYVGLLSAGVHTHYAYGALDVSIGADLVAVGPSTRMSELQEWYHDLLSFPAPLGVNEQLEDAVYLSGAAELAWPLRVSDTVTVRPFAAVQAGVEDIARVGVDIILGTTGHNDLLLRDEVTGQLIRGVENDFRGYNVTLGADWAEVRDSVFLPSDLGYAAEDSRWRMRAGLNVQVTSEVSFFYGATYLSEEFVGQTEGQVLGGVKLNFNF